MKRSGLRRLRTVLTRRQATLFLAFVAFSGVSAAVAYWPVEHRATAELRIEPAALAPGVALEAPSIEGRLEPLVRQVLQDTGSPPGVRIVANTRRDGRVIEVSAPGEDSTEATRLAKNVAQSLIAHDTKDRREITEKVLADATQETVQAVAAERANRGALELLRPQGIASDAPLTTRALTALSIEREAHVKDDATQVAEREAEVIGLEGESRLKRDQLLDEAAAARKLADKGGAKAPLSDGTSGLAKLPGWAAWRAAGARLEAAEQKLALARTKLARDQLELERVKNEVEHWPERSQVLARLESSQPGLKRAAEDAQARAERASRALEIERGKDATRGTPERLVLVESLTAGVPEGPDRNVRLLFGLVLAIPAAIAAALVREWQDRSLYAAETWRDSLGVPVLGRVPDLREPGRGVGAR